MADHRLAVPPASPVLSLGISFAGVTHESEDDVRYFVETFQRPLRSVSILADEQGVLTDGYQVGAARYLVVYPM